MTPEQFKRWRKDMRLPSRKLAAEILGVSASTIELYETGFRRDTREPVRIPDDIAEACERLLGNLKPVNVDRLPVWLCNEHSYSFRKFGTGYPHGHLIVPRPNAMACDIDGKEYLEFGESSNRLLLRMAVEAGRRKMHGLSWEVFRQEDA